MNTFNPEALCQYSHTCIFYVITACGMQSEIVLFVVWLECIYRRKNKLFHKIHLFHSLGDPITLLLGCCYLGRVVLAPGECQV